MFMIWDLYIQVAVNPEYDANVIMTLTSNCPAAEISMEVEFAQSS